GRDRMAQGAPRRTAPLGKTPGALTWPPLYLRMPGPFPWQYHLCRHSDRDAFAMLFRVIHASPESQTEAQQPPFTPLDTAVAADKTEFDARRRSELRVVWRESSRPHAPPANSTTASHGTTASGGEHDAPSGSLEPPPKGEGTVWQSARLNRSDQTASIYTTKRENEAWPRASARRRWASIGSDHAPRFTLDVAGGFAVPSLPLPPPTPF